MAAASAGPWQKLGTWIGTRIGTGLFQRALERGRQLGAGRMEWEAEPNAIGFYEKMGGRYLRDAEPNAWGRIIAVMGVDLDTVS